MLIWLLVAVLALFGAWVGIGIWSTFGIEEPKYEVIKEADGYEIRKYSAYVLAKTEVTGPYKEALNEGFRIIAGYIFGDNVSNQKINMTSPVLNAPAAEKIAMTAPVLTQTTESDAFSVAFVMPHTYTLATLPKPNDNRISFALVPARTVAVSRFSGWVNHEVLKNETERLRKALKRDGQTILQIESARYNPPWTPPFLMRNEIWAVLQP